MATNFKLTFSITKQTNLNKFINYKLDSTKAVLGESILIEKLNENSFKKITSTTIDLPKVLLDLIGFQKLDIEEKITISNGQFISIIESPSSVSNKLKFKETYVVVQIGENIKCDLNVEGINYLPSGLKKMAEKIYFNKRKTRIISELNSLLKNDDDNSIMQ